MNLQRAETLCNELMKVHGIDLIGYRFEWLRAKRKSGHCNYTRKRIGLSKPLTELADEVDVKDTILHEIAHALCPNHGHDHIWQMKAREIGCNGFRCYGTNGTKDSLVKARAILAKYEGVCPNGHKHYANRMPKNKKSCGKCCPRFNTNFLITFSLKP